LVRQQFPLCFGLPVEKETPKVDVRKPTWDQGNGKKPRLLERNLIKVEVKGKDRLLLRGEPFPLEDLTKQVKEMIGNPDQHPDYAESPKRAIVSLGNDRDADYDHYLAVYNALKAAYTQLWEEKAQQDYQQAYEALTKDQQKAIRQHIPMVISEAEPTAF
ncbi:MAG: hypothetical protein AAF598_00275, partial [Bacteroidota bacterium]